MTFMVAGRPLTPDGAWNVYVGDQPTAEFLEFSADAGHASAEDAVKAYAWGDTPTCAGLDEASRAELARALLAHIEEDATWTSAQAADARRARAYENGLQDGMEWDLDDYADRAAVEADKRGWSEATINAIGSAECRRAWGVSEGDDGEAWAAAMADYDAGALAGALAPQEERNGRPPADQCDCSSCKFARG